MKIKQIEIIQFRNLADISLDFEAGLNAIAGQNGTSKTSILGLVGHLFSYPATHKTLLGKGFYTNFSEIFRFAYPDYDKPGDHHWIAKFDQGKDAPAVSYARKEKGRKETIRVRVRESKRGEGKIEFPVIYLGMGRLFPLALEESILNNKSELTESEVIEFARLHNEILLIQDTVQPESITASNKTFYAPKTEKYNHLGNSAGQDNLGQIITALLSFKRLQRELGDKYKGGILLIDELDASLFPAAQMKLVQRLSQKMRELNLQVFFTTHSLEVLTQVAEYEDSQVIFLDNSHGKIIPRYNLDINFLQERLLIKGPDALKEMIKKKYVYVEDKEAEDMLKNILPNDIKKRIKIVPTKLGHTVLSEISKRNIPDFRDSLIVLDGDSGASARNVLILPGNQGPDRLIYNLLHKLKADHEFWTQIPGFYKQFCFRELNNLEDETLDENKKRKRIKKWYIQNRKYWGQLGNKVWKLWIRDNRKEVDQFIERFKKMI